MELGDKYKDELLAIVYNNMIFLNILAFSQTSSLFLNDSFRNNTKYYNNRWGNITRVS